MVMTDLVIKSVNETTGCALVEAAVEVAVETAATVIEVVAGVEADLELADLPELVDHASEESDDKDLDDEESDDNDVAPEVPVERRKSKRIKAGVLPPERLTYIAKNK